MKTVTTIMGKHQRPSIFAIMVFLAVATGAWFGIDSRSPWLRASSPDKALKPTLSGRSPNGIDAPLASEPVVAIPIQPSSAAETGLSSQLLSYARLKNKAILSESDQEERLRLLGHVELIQSLAPLLTRAMPIGSVEREWQNQAIDLLIEAATRVNSRVAAEVLRTVISDEQIEHPKTHNSIRENLAGIKADIMYQWTALNPEIIERIPMWLPGPVSERIWRNVVRVQQQNREESLREGEIK